MELNAQFTTGYNAKLNGYNRISHTAKTVAVIVCTVNMLKKYAEPYSGNIATLHEQHIAVWQILTTLVVHAIHQQ